jgi:hypothetical protein
MAKLMYKGEQVNGAVTYSISNSMDYLNKAVNECYSMSIPSSFSGRRGLENCKSQIFETRRRLLDLKEWIDKTERTLMNLERDLQGSSIVLPKLQLLDRNLAAK